MSTPLATPTDLGVYLGQPIPFDDPRGFLLLQLAHDRLEMHVQPVPSAAKGIELAVAARAWSNITSANQMGLGSAQVSYGSQNSTFGLGGLFVSKAEIRDLRLAAGRRGAGSIDMVPPAVPPSTVPSVDGVTPNGAATGDLVRITGSGFTGTISVTFGGVAAEFLEVDDNVLHAAVPAGAPGVVPVVVTNAVGASLPVDYERG